MQQDSDVTPRDSKKLRIKRGKKAFKKKPHKWGFIEELTEPEGRALEAYRLWKRAETDFNLRLKLLVMDELSLLLELSKSELEEYFSGSPKKSVGLPMVHAVRAYKRAYKKRYHGE